MQCSAVVRVCADRSSAHSHADKLVDGVALTTDDSHMWLIPFTLGNKHVLSVSLAAPVQIGALVLHNYNKSFEDSFRGVQVRYTNAVRLKRCHALPRSRRGMAIGRFLASCSLVVRCCS